MKSSVNVCTVLGVDFEIHTRDMAMRRIEDILSARGNARVFTPNAEILYRADKDDGLRELLNSADLCLPDGAGVVIASRFSPEPLPERICGIDTAEHILGYAATHGLSVFLLGGRQGVAEAAEAALKKRLPTLRICGTHHGYFDPDGQQNDALLQMIRQARPDILFVCLGFPAQERWIAKSTPSLPFLRLSMGLGGSLDIWSGRLRRSPAVFRRLGLEWLWRIICEPRRLCRLPFLLGFVFKVLTKKMLNR